MSTIAEPSVMNNLESLSQLQKIAEALGSTLSFILSDDTQNTTVQTVDFNQTGSSNSQKIKVTKAPTHELAK
jgi:hypothetical protein